MNPHAQQQWNRRFTPTAINLDPMRVFGVDCGTEVTGFGVVDSDEESLTPKLVCQTLGAIVLPKQKKLPARLEQVFHELSQQMAR